MLLRSLAREGKSDVDKRAREEEADAERDEEESLRRRQKGKGRMAVLMAKPEEMAVLAEA